MSAVTPARGDQTYLIEPETSRARANIYFMGAGILFPEQLTLQTLAALDECSVVYTNLRQSDLVLLADNLAAKIHSIWTLYQEGRERSLNYEDIIALIERSATDGLPVGWLTQGHPTIFDSVTQALLRAADERDWSVCVVPSMSCIDTVLAQLGYDPANGLVVFEAEAVVHRDIHLSPKHAVLLLQPSAFGSSLTNYRIAQTPDLQPLKNHLFRFYAPDQVVAFVRSASRQSGPPNIHWLVLSELTHIPPEDLFGSTMFIPAAPSHVTSRVPSHIVTEDLR